MEFVRYHFKSIDSTNTWAKKNTHLLDPNRLTLVTAEAQSSGRGRAFRVWESPAAKNIYASFCFVVPKEIFCLGNISQVMAISASAVLEKIGFEVKLKWPNDLVLAGKKLGGILCEIETVADVVWVILGIGININMPQELLKAIDQPATSLFVEGGNRAIETGMVSLALMQEFSANLDLFLKNGFSFFLPHYKAKLVHDRGGALRFRQGKELWEGTFDSINEDGSLNLVLNSGEIKKFISGELV